MRRTSTSGKLPLTISGNPGVVVDEDGADDAEAFLPGGHLALVARQPLTLVARQPSGVTV